MRLEHGAELRRAEIRPGEIEQDAIAAGGAVADQNQKNRVAGFRGRREPGDGVGDRDLRRACVDAVGDVLGEVHDAIPRHVHARLGSLDQIGRPRGETAGEGGLAADTGGDDEEAATGGEAGCRYQ